MQKLRLQRSRRHRDAGPAPHDSSGSLSAFIYFYPESSAGVDRDGRSDCVPRKGYLVSASDHRADWPDTKLRFFHSDHRAVSGRRFKLCVSHGRPLRGSGSWSGCAVPGKSSHEGKRGDSGSAVWNFCCDRPGSGNISLISFKWNCLKRFKVLLRLRRQSSYSRKDLF